MLKAQHHHYISAFQPFVEISESSRTHLLYGFRHQGRRGDHADLRAQGRKADDVGACHATMQHIAAYRDYQSLDMPLAPSDGERVEQCLCRMFVSSIAGIQHRESTLSAISCTAPELWCRIKITSARMAFRVTAVSISVSPFFTLDCAACMLTTSAPSLFPATSNDSSVRVLFSKKALDRKSAG